MSKYTEKEIVSIADLLQNQINQMIADNYDDYIIFLEPGAGLDDIYKVEVYTKPEMQESKKNGQLHFHTILSIAHSTRIRLDYQKIKQDAYKLGYVYDKPSEEDKDDEDDDGGGGGFGNFNAEIHLASTPSALSEFEYLDEEGLEWEPQQVKEYWEATRDQIDSGLITMKDAIKFTKRKRETIQKELDRIKGTAH